MATKKYESACAENGGQPEASELSKKNGGEKKTTQAKKTTSTKKCDRAKNAKKSLQKREGKKN